MESESTAVGLSAPFNTEKFADELSARFLLPSLAGRCASNSSKTPEWLRR